MSESIGKRTNSMANHRDAEAMRKVLTTALADLTALRAAFLLLTAKLDLDGGVTDTNYAALTNPAALTTIA